MKSESEEERSLPGHWGSLFVRGSGGTRCWELWSYSLERVFHLKYLPPQVWNYIISNLCGSFEIFFLVQLSHEKIRMGSLGMLLVDYGCGMWILEKGSRKGAVKEKMERHRSSSAFPPSSAQGQPLWLGLQEERGSFVPSLVPHFQKVMLSWLGAQGCGDCFMVGGWDDHPLRTFFWPCRCCNILIRNFCFKYKGCVTNEEGSRRAIKTKLSGPSSIKQNAFLPPARL